MVMSRAVPGVGFVVGGSTEVTNVFHEGKDGKSSHAAHTVEGGALMIMLVLTEGIARAVSAYSEGSKRLLYGRKGDYPEDV
jgi:hypothetical protein